MTLAHNPSHLEAVDPVVEGNARALQTDHSQGTSASRPQARRADPHSRRRRFTGQGIVAEVFNLQSLPGYETGGTIHLIANNQIGFTTDPPTRARRAMPPILRKASTFRSFTSTPTTSTRASQRFISSSIFGELSAATCSSISSATAASGTTSRTNPRTRSRRWPSESRITRPCASSSPTNSSIKASSRAERAQAMVEEANERLQQARHAVRGALASHIKGRKLASSNTFDGTVVAPVERRRWSRGADAFGRTRRICAQSQVARSVRSAQRDHRREGRRRLGNGRIACLRFVAGNRNADSTDGTRYGARDLQSSPRRLSSLDSARDGPVAYQLDSVAASVGNSSLVRDPQQSAFGICLRRLRIRLLDRAIRGARPLGGAVRRLRQRRGNHHRSIHCRRTSKMGGDVAAHAPSSARLRRRRTGTFERAPGALSPTRRRRQSCASPPLRPRATTITCCECRRARRLRFRSSS